MVKRKIFSTVFICFLIIPFLLSLPTIGAQDYGYTGIHDPDFLMEDIPPFETWDGTYLLWDVSSESEQESWEWLNQAWEFGPYPSFKVLLWNGTEVTDDNFIPLGEEGKFKCVIEINKAVFAGMTKGGSEVTLGRTGLHWHMNLKDPENGTELGWASVDMMYVYNSSTHDWKEADTWHVSSMMYNKSSVVTDMGKPPQPEAEQNFFVWDESNSSTTEDYLKWTIEFVGFFNETVTPTGPFWVNLEVTDSQNNWIDFGYAAWSSGVSPNRGVAVGVPGLFFGGYDETWSFQKLDVENRTVYSVSRGSLWKMRVNVTSDDLANVTLAMHLPWDMVTYVNRTDWHQETRIEKGGWLYNETAGTYYWDPDVNVTSTVQVYGPFLEKHWIHTTREPKRVGVTRRIDDNNFIEETIEVWPDKIFLVYDHVTHSFTMKQGYSYWAYDPDRGYDRDYTVMEPVNTSDPATRFYNLSMDDCSWSQIGEGEYMIEFVGSFSDTTYSEQSEYWIEEPRIYTLDGHQIWCNWEEISPSDFQIAVDRLVCVTTVFDSRGREIKWGTLQVDPGSFFTIQGKLQGVGLTYDDIDGVGFTLWGWGDEKWISRNESRHSEVEMRLIKDLTTGVITSVTYNRTLRDAYLYGSYQDWIMVNVTDWHQEYNATIGAWEWVKAPNMIWNWTTLTGWHWEHLILNQTEYALNEASPDIWINTQDNWLPNEDPTYIVKKYNATSEELTAHTYAELYSADISLIEGIATVDLNITFSTDVPQTRYSWNLNFLNTTFGVDWSQGWGMHEVTSWTTESTYYINETTTDNEPWYITRPETPFYTIFNGKRYNLEEIPYITIDGTDYPIQVKTDYDWGMDEDRTEVLIWDQYDPTIDEQPRYYLLLNGTKVSVREGYVASIRTITLNTTDIYQIDEPLTDGYEIEANDQDFLANGTILETFMDHAEQDWGKSFRYQPNPEGEPWWWEWMHPYYYELLDGTRIYRNQPFETQNYNWTTNRWDLSNTAYYDESATNIMIKRLGRGVLLNNTLLALLHDHASWWQPLPDGTGYYLTMNGITYEDGVKQYNDDYAGTAIVHEDPWEVPEDQRFVFINGEKYLCRDWPEDYYEGTYEDQTIIIKSGWRGYVRNFYYTLWADDDAREMPYPEAGATSWWDLEGTESEGRKLPTYKYFVLNGTKHVLSLSEDVGEGFYIMYDESRESVAWPKRDLTNYYCLINGMEFWNVTQTGWNLNLGTYTWRGGFEGTVPFVTTTGFNDETGEWREWDRAGMDRENATMYLTAPNGTRYNLQTALALYVWKVDIGGKIYYTFNDWTQTEQTLDETAGEHRWKNYIITLNGTRVYFDWEQNPVNFIQEYRILIPGTNYTRLIPYSWGTEYVFDTIHLHNITINNQVSNGTFWDIGDSFSTTPYYSMTTGVFYDNGTEVPAGTLFKVIGGPAGPSTRSEYDENYARDPNNWWIHQLSGEEELPWMAGWSILAQWSYMITLDGTLLYFVAGTYHDMDSKMWYPQQWNWTGGMNGGNKTVKVKPGGYAIFLNDTMPVAVTTEWTQWMENEEYLIMENGTWLSVQWDPNLNRYITMINDKFYTFRDVHTLCNLTDSGIEYSVYDPYQRIRVREHWDRWNRMLSPSPRLTTTISEDWLQNCLWMNSASDSVLYDTSYYLTNASDQSRLDLMAVIDWWNETSMGARKDALEGIRDGWILENNKPLYNVTIDGQEYFVIDPSPIGGEDHASDGWNNRWSVEPWHALYRYPETFDVTLDGTPYTIQFRHQGATYWEERPFPETYPDIRYSYRLIDLCGDLEVEEESQWKAALSVTFGGEDVSVQLEEMNIYKKHTMWGELYTWKLTEMEVMTVRSIWDLVVGIPDWGMWGVRAFETVPETGAVDLDGELSTKDDQYFVRRLHYGSDSWNRTEDRMLIEIIWNPEASMKGDEVHISAWTGRMRNSWSFEWSEYFIWYYASNMSIVSDETMQQINTTLIDGETGKPNPGYWDVAHMAKNSTWEDLLLQAQREGWDWIKDNTHEWEWIWFGFSQDYQTSWMTDDLLQQVGIGLRYEFSGLSLYNLTEQTHYFMPESVGNLTFLTP